MIVTLASFKGGVGKSTTAVHLATYFSQKSDRVLLVDGDPNQSSLNWSERGELPFQVCGLMAAPRQSQGKEFIIIDTEAHPDEKQLKTLAEGCDLMILPSTCDALALEALIATAEQLQGLGRFGVVLTMVDSRKKATAKQARQALEGIGLKVFKQEIRRFTAYERAALKGVPVGRSGDRFSGIAWGEYQNLGREIEKYVG